jgi:hypothetical protein
LLLSTANFHELLVFLGIEHPRQLCG